MLKNWEKHNQPPVHYICYGITECYQCGKRMPRADEIERDMERARLKRAMLALAVGVCVFSILIWAI